MTDASPQTTLGELTALSQTPYLGLRGPTFKVREGRRCKGKRGGEEGGAK